MLLEEIILCNEGVLVDDLLLQVVDVIHEPLVVHLVVVDVLPEHRQLDGAAVQLGFGLGFTTLGDVGLCLEDIVGPLQLLDLFVGVGLVSLEMILGSLGLFVVCLIYI